jgi:hypothetical protein
LGEGELNISPTPSQSDLDMLSGDWIKKVSWRTKKEKEDEEEDVNLSQYYDAEAGNKSPPLGSSPKKEPVKEKKKVRRTESTGSSGSDSLFSSVSTHSSCSPEQLKKKAERRIIKLSKALREDDLSEEHLKTMKFDASAMSKKIDSRRRGR